MVNPFQVTKPVGPSEVIDRDGQARELVDLAVEGNNARLVAPRRFGKTSLINRVQAQLESEGWLCVSVDLLGILSIDDFTARIEQAYTRQLTGPVARWWAGVRRSLKPSASLGGGPVPASIGVDLAGASKEALVERLDLPKRVSARTGQRVHVVFDEFQEVDRLAQKNVDQLLRSVIQHHDTAVSYLFAGSELHMMEMMFADPKRAFYGQAQKVSLRPLDHEALADYLVTRFESTGKTLHGEVLGGLLDLVRGHPQRAMAAAHVLWRNTDREADPADWENSVLMLMDEVDDELRALWMASNGAEREVLVLVAAGRSPYSRAAGRARGGTTVSAFNALQASGVIARRDDGGSLIVDPLFAAWILAQRG